jgi:hypothetical protein
MNNPGTLAAAGAQEVVIAGELDAPENTAGHRALQAAHLVRRLGIDHTAAAAIAHLFFGDMQS